MNYYLMLGLVLLVYMTVWFGISVLKKRNDVADIAWGLGFVLLTWVSLVTSGVSSVASLVTAVLVTMWGVRLAWHIHARNKGKTEDYRYLAWRKEWGKWFYLRSYAQVYLLQGLLLYLILFPVVLFNAYSSTTIFGFLGYVGVLIWGIGFFFESVGDAQLGTFMRDPRNKGALMKSGLWRYTRHPNYFGEVTQWWGIWLITLNSPYGWYGIIGPVVITILILKVSGIPMLEKKMEQNPQFAEYKKRTSMFFPLPPK